MGLHIYKAPRQGIYGLTRSSAAWAAANVEPKLAIVPPGGTVQVLLHMLRMGEGHAFGKHLWQAPSYIFGHLYGEVEEVEHGPFRRESP